MEVYIKYKNGAPTDELLSIYATLAGLPTGSALATCSISGITSSFDWRTATLSSPLSLTASTRYAIAVHASTNGSNCLVWEVNGNNVLPAEQCGESTNGGSSWSGYGSPYDCNFKVYSVGSSAQAWVQIK